MPAPPSDTPQTPPLDDQPPPASRVPRGKADEGAPGDGGSEADHLAETLLDAPPFHVALRRDLGRGVRSGLETFWSLAKAMVPAYGLALILERLGVIAALAHVAQPLMSLVGLPGSAAVPLVLGYVLNVYAAVGAMAALHLDAVQITVLGLAILIGHNLLVEGAVLRKAGMSGIGFGVFRAVSGLLAAGLANLLIRAFT